jgi:hypothetical protein
MVEGSRQDGKNRFAKDAFLIHSEGALPTTAPPEIPPAFASNQSTVAYDW